MKVLILNVSAKYGSTGTIVSLLENHLIENGHSPLVCYGDVNESFSDSRHIKLLPNWNVYFNAFIKKIVGNGFGFNYLATLKLIRVIKSFKPDVVQIFNPHAYYVNLYILLNYLKRRKIPTVYSMMDENAYTGTCFFTYDCKKYCNHCIGCSFKESYNGSPLFSQGHYTNIRKSKCYEGFEKIWFVGGNAVINKAKASSLLRGKQLYQIEEPVDLTKTFTPRSVVELKKRLGIDKSDKVVLTITKLSNPRKGGQFFLDLYSSMRNEKGYAFVYVGFDTEQYGHPEGLLTIPYINSLNELADYYSLADVFVFTSIADTTPNTIIQALGCGSPVCCFDIDGISSMNLTADILSTAPVGDTMRLKELVMKVPQKDSLIIERCRHSVEDYSSTKVMNEYLSFYKSILR